MKRLGHVPALNGVRGVAILAVTGLHFFGLRGGFFGVDLFFVLSGFLITTLLLEAEPPSIKNGLRTFYGRRASRLLPALGVLLMFCVPLAGLRTTGEASLYVSNVIAAHSGPTSALRRVPLDHLWSLAEEEQFYLVWPVLLFLALRHLPRPTIRQILIGAFFVLIMYRAALVLTGASWSRIYFAPDTHADGLVLGCLIALWRPRIPAWSAWLAALATLAFFALGVQTSTTWLMFGLPAFEICAALLVLGAVEGHISLFSWRPLVWLGLISYSLYLWQQPARFVAGVQQPGWRALPVAFLFAIGSYYLVEKRFRHRMQGEPVATPAPAVTG